MGRRSSADTEPLSVTGGPGQLHRPPFDDPLLYWGTASRRQSLAGTPDDHPGSRPGRVTINPSRVPSSTRPRYPPRRSPAPRSRRRPPSRRQQHDRHGHFNLYNTSADTVTRAALDRHRGPDRRYGASAGYTGHRSRVRTTGLRHGYSGDTNVKSVGSGRLTSPVTSRPGRARPINEPSLPTVLGYSFGAPTFDPSKATVTTATTRPARSPVTTPTTQNSAGAAPRA